MLTAALALAGCATGGPAPAPDARPAAAGPVSYPADGPCPPLAERARLSMPAVATSASSSWMYVAQARGLFAACGLDVEITQANTSAQTSAYLAGELPIAVVGGGTPGAIAATGRPLAVLAVLGNAPVFSMLARTPVTSAADVRGATIGVLSPVDGTNKVAHYYLGQQGVPAGEVTFAYLNTMPNVVAALESGAVDLAVLSAPSADIQEFRGMVRVADFHEAPIDNPANAVIAEPTWLAEHPDVAANLLRAVLAGVYQVQADPQAGSPVIAQALGIDPATPEGAAAMAGVQRTVHFAYRPVRDILTVDAPTVELFRSTAPPEIADRLRERDMTELLPTPDVGAGLAADGFAAHLERLYGPLPAG
ncbi:hypothetical protein BJF78_04350 [Pseudonocardia sp. CNS-139]|nr:hypothetical protein BJF78_04350 [Pseudonocardia sp. CNS-139]